MTGECRQIIVETMEPVLANSLHCVHFIIVDSVLSEYMKSLIKNSSIGLEISSCPFDKLSWYS